jgi:hypothetical protein
MYLPIMAGGHSLGARRDPSPADGQISLPKI